MGEMATAAGEGKRERIEGEIERIRRLRKIGKIGVSL